MAPSATETATVSIPTGDVGNGKVHAKEVTKADEQDVEAPTHYEETLPERLVGHKEPLKLSGALDQFEHFDVTPVIGREYVNVNLAELLRAPNSDDLIRDLAITSMSKAPRQYFTRTNMPLVAISLPARRRLLPQARRRHQ